MRLENVAHVLFVVDHLPAHLLRGGVVAGQGVYPGGECSVRPRLAVPLVQGCRGVRRDRAAQVEALGRRRQAPIPDGGGKMNVERIKPDYYIVKRFKTISIVEGKVMIPKILRSCKASNLLHRNLYEVHVNELEDLPSIRF